MSDFIQHLAARVLAPTTALRPRLPGAYEPVRRLEEPAPDLRERIDAAAPVARSTESSTLAPDTPHPAEVTSHSGKLPHGPAPRLFPATAAAPLSSERTVESMVGIEARSEALVDAPLVPITDVRGGNPVEPLLEPAQHAAVIGANERAQPAQPHSSKATLELPTTALQRTTPMPASSARPAAASNHESSLRPSDVAPARERIRPSTPRTATLVHPAQPLLGPPLHGALTRGELDAGPALTAPRPLASRAESVSVEPTINISIGRVDIRASAPAPIPAGARRQARPQLALGDYLAQRGGKAGR